jgi:hypothetical protein
MNRLRVRLALLVVPFCWLLCLRAADLMSEVERQAQLPHLVHVHAHNDYEHAHPLFDALSHGFPSVEADIHLVDGQLLVAHDRDQVDPARTLQSLYLDPLRERARRFGGRIYPKGDPTFYLLIDTKSDTNATYAVLRRVLDQYAEILTSFGPDGVKQKAITVVLTGNRPREVLAQQSARLAGLDGVLSDLDAADPTGLFLWISDNWRAYFTWRASGPFPPQEKARVIEIAKKAHARNLKVRFWNAPDTPAFWREIRAAGVDLINTDDLSGAETFLRQQPAGN